MDKDEILQLLTQIETGKITAAEGAERLSDLCYIDIGCAKIDTSREGRRGFPEVIYGAGKTPEQICQILEKLATASTKNIIVSRCSAETYACIVKKLPEAQYNETARMIYLCRQQEHIGNIAVVCAGTSDLPVAEEARLTAELMGANVTAIYDVGVAGIHRLLAAAPKLKAAKTIIAVAGMEGALPSVVGGLVACPVIAVPTSVGYGASFGGIAALLAMLNSCSSGVTVVNIDNGFGAGYAAAVINKQSVLGSVI